MAFNNAKWIWHSLDFGENEYAEFFDTFYCTNSDATVNISVCGDYTLFINGQFAASNQYSDFEHYKVFDTIDISKHLKSGENTILVLVWYFGRSGMRYLTPKPGLIFELFSGETLLLSSSEATPSRNSRAYLSGDTKTISPQLGYSFTYNKTLEDDFTDGFGPSFVVQEKRAFYPRPIKKQINGELVKGQIIKEEENCYLVDLGEERLGLFALDFCSNSVQKINVSYGEYLTDSGHVNRLIANRDFSFDYIAKEGKNCYTNYMFRFAGRYIELKTEAPIEIGYIGVIPQYYPANEKAVDIKDNLDRQIYEICLNSLRLCMMEHYVDCPWREQCLYAYDSRNQMLTGYYAFEDGNFEYVAANLLLMSKDMREDGLLSICFPSGEDLTIPSFSLYYILSVMEYTKYSNDLSLANKVFEKLESILLTFKNNIEDGLVNTFEGINHWNFYDWTQYFEGKLWQEDFKRPDYMINAVYLLALKSFDYICSRLGRANAFAELEPVIKKNLRAKFFNCEQGCYFMENPTEKPTELANSLAILLDLVDEKEAESIAKRLATGEFLSCTLSMKPFKYDALLKVDKSLYKDTILSEIRTTYKTMLDAGFTTTWEVVLDRKAMLEGSWSHCHGWSAIPIYYFNTLGIV